jgi:GTPase Era involved in 16S rRNA processing
MPNRDVPLRLAVAGHTNTGKTSLLRTLTRDPDFGQVQDSPGTTRHVEGARLLVEGRTVVELFDTPGMEDSMGLQDYLDQLSASGERADGPERIRRFLDTPESKRRFEQEARVLAKLLDCDAALYVIDVRDPVLGKHKDELAILASCGKPILPVLNFIGSPQPRVDAWRATLARTGLHAVVEFDTIAPALDGEDQLYDKLALLLDAHASALAALRSDIALQRELRRRDASRLIAELLIDAAAWRLSSEPDEAALKTAVGTLRRRVREREEACVRALLKRYNFSVRDFPAHTLPLEGERWGMDLFHPQALKEVGVHVGKGMAAGAMAGATLDVFTAGLSLGAATLIGATAGGLWQGADKLGKRMLGRLRGYQELTVNDEVLRLLALRQLALAQALERRGHAAQQPVALDDSQQTPSAQAQAWRKSALPKELLEARSQPHWSALADDYNATPRREHAVQTLMKQLIV